MNNARQFSVRAVFLAAGCVLVGAAVTYFVVTREPSQPPTEVEVVPNLEEARAQAERGDAAAQKTLGTIYAKGQGVKQSYAEAAKWYRLAADQGYAEAQVALAELCEAGQGVPFDASEAVKWYRQAAEQGNVTAQYCLAVLYLTGKGVAQSKPEAVKWYRKAAEQGEPLAQYNLGMRHKEGDGVPVDLPEAYKWLSLAAAQKIADAAPPLDDLKRTMSREQLAEGRRRLEAFQVNKTPPAAR